MNSWQSIISFDRILNPIMMNSQSYTILDFEKYLYQKQNEFIGYRKEGIEQINKKLIELGKTLGVFPDVWKIRTNKVKGCTSKVYIHANLANNKVYYSGDSESEIVRGQIALLVNGLNQLTPQEIVNESEAHLDKFVKNTDVRFSMTISRTNSIGTLYQFMKNKAQEFLNS